jgi:hypothetical protein
MTNPELLADRDGPYCMLGAKDAFDGLTTKERMYAYHMLRSVVSLQIKQRFITMSQGGFLWDADTSSSDISRI